MHESRIPRRDSLVCGFVALLFYACLAQRTLYSVDAHGFLMQTMRGGVAMSPTHFSYMPLLALCREIAAATGTSLHTCAVWLSAVGVAIGVACAHAANRRLGVSRTTALWATAFTAATPALVFFATVVEVHGQHFGLCGATFFATACFAVRPCLGNGVWLGAACGLGYLGHATGAILPVMVVPCALALARQHGFGWQKCTAGLAAAVIVHGMLLFFIPRLLGVLGFSVGTDLASDLLRMHLLGLWHDPLAVFDAAWRDWLRPFAPWSAVLLAAVVVARTRVLATGLALAGVGYIVIAAALLVPFVNRVQQAWHGTELGAYQLPLAWPLGLLAAQLVVGRGPRALLLAIAIAIAWAGVARHDTRPQHEFAIGLRQACGTEPLFLLAGGHEEVAGFVIELPELIPERDWQLPALMLDVPEGQLLAMRATYEAWLRAKHAAGVRLWLTAGCLETLTSPAWTRGRPAAAVLLAGLRSDFVWEEHRAAGFHGWRLVPKG